MGQVRTSWDIQKLYTTLYICTVGQPGKFVAVLDICEGQSNYCFSVFYKAQNVVPSTNTKHNLWKHNHRMSVYLSH